MWPSRSAASLSRAEKAGEVVGSPAVLAISRMGKARVIDAMSVFYLVHGEGRKTPRQVHPVEVKDQIREALTSQKNQSMFAE